MNTIRWYLGAVVLALLVGAPASQGQQGVPANHAPTTPALRSFGVEPTTDEVFVDLLALASDPDGDPLSCRIVSPPDPAAGSLVPGPSPCTYRFLPVDPAAFEEAWVDYEVDDGISVSPASGAIGFHSVQLVFRPGAPRGLVATPQGATGVALSWLDNSDNESGFWVSRKDPPPAFRFEIVAELPADSTSYLGTGLTEGATYEYIVQAFNAAGVSDASEVVAVTVGAGGGPSEVLVVTKDSATGTPVPHNSVVTYPAATQGGSYPGRQFLLHNASPVGSGTTLTVTSVTSSDPAWTITESPAGQTWFPGGFRSLRLALDTADLGLQESVIRIDSTDPASPFLITVRATVVEAPPEVTITQHPADQYVPEGGTAWFSVAAIGGTGGLGYQWYEWLGGFHVEPVEDGGHYSGAETATLTVSDVDAGDTGSYFAHVYDLSDPQNSNNSNTALLSLVQVPITIDNDPIDAWAGWAESATFEVLATGGTPALTYQWLYGGVALDAGHPCWPIVQGAQSPSLAVDVPFGSLPPGCDPYGLQYSARVSDGLTSVDSRGVELHRGTVPGPNSSFPLLAGEGFATGRLEPPATAPGLDGKRADYGGRRWSADPRLVYGVADSIGGAVATNSTSAGGGSMVATVPVRLSERVHSVSVRAEAGLAPASEPGSWLGFGLSSSPDGSFGVDGQLWVRAKQISASQLSWKLFANGTGQILASGVGPIEDWRAGATGQRQWILTYDPLRRVVGFSHSSGAGVSELVLPAGMEPDVAHAGFTFRPASGQSPAAGFAVDLFEVDTFIGGEVPEIVDPFEALDFSRWSSVMDPAGQLDFSQAAPLSGAASLEVRFDGGISPAYLQYDLAHSTSELSAEFLFDLGSVVVGEGGSHRLFEIGPSAPMSGAPPVSVDLQWAEGFFDLRAGARTSSGAAVHTPWRTVPPGPMRLQVRWANANVPIPLLELQIISEEGSTLDTVIPDGTVDAGYLRLGPSARKDAGTTGSYYLDDFEAWRPTHYAYSLGDDFESGGLSGWSSVVDPAGRFEVGAAAALVGDYGLAIGFDGSTDPAWLAGPLASPASRYRAAFLLDLANLALAEGDVQRVFAGAGPGGASRFEVDLRFAKSAFSARARVTSDAGTLHDTPWLDLAPSTSLVEVEWWTPAAQGRDTGGASLTVNGGSRAETGSVDNATQELTEVRLGVDGVSSATMGTCRIDELESWVWN